NQKIERLHDVSRRLVGCKTEGKVYKTTVDAAEGVLDFTLAALGIVQGNKLVMKAASFEIPDDKAGKRENDEEMICNLDEDSLAANTWRSETTTVFGSKDEVVDPGSLQTEAESGIMAPISNIGVFQVASLKKDAFTTEDVHLLEILLGHTGEAIKRIRLQEELEDQATRDPLTNVRNRRYFDLIIEREVNRSKRHDNPLHVLMIDIDQFKKVNDTYGHQVGDQVLQGVAELLVEQVRDTDVVVRYGGDEFLILLIEAQGATQMVSDRIQSALERRNQTKEIAPFRVQISIGAADWLPDGEVSPKEALADADRRMYEAKRNTQQSTAEIN
ncbi:GGDEF domain-containing protein, partial [Myxococcota bacterium]|nr:GGDEF domain-containing protein [Myxococcota bacterium]